VSHDNCSSTQVENVIFMMFMFLCVFTLTTGTAGDIVSLSTFLLIVDFKCKFFLVDKMLVVDITIKIIRKLCYVRKVDKIYVLILVSMDL